MDKLQELSDFLGTQIEKLNSIKMKKTPQEGNTCLQMYDGRLSKCEVINVNNEEFCFDVITSFGAKMHNIPFDKFKPYDIDELLHHKDTTVGLYATDKPIGDLLQMFWQRSSDACPLECTEAEKQESEFKEWVKSISFQIS